MGEHQPAADSDVVGVKCQRRLQPDLRIRKEIFADGVWLIRERKAGEVTQMKIKGHPMAVGCILMLWSLFAIAASPAPIPKATPKPTPQPESPVLFRVSALKDLADLKKDIGDAQLAVEKGGKWKLLGNSVEIKYNIVQLRLRRPPTQYSKNWNSVLAQIDVLSDQFSKNISGGSVASTRSTLSSMLSLATALETYVKTVN